MPLIVNDSAFKSSRGSVDAEDIAGLFQRGRRLAAGNDVFNQFGDEINLNNMMLEYAIGEQNYERTKPEAIASQLQALGMSRAAALEAAAGASPANTSVSPQAVSPPTLQPALDVANTAISAASTAYNIYRSQKSLPYELRAMDLNNQALEQQTYRTDQEIQGLEGGASMLQDVANQTSQNADIFKNMTPSQIIDAYKTATPDSPLYNASQSDWFKKFVNNPFAYAAFAKNYSADLEAGAKQYDLQTAYENYRQFRLANDITQNYKTNLLPLVNNMYSNEEIRSTLLTNYDNYVMKWRALCDQQQLAFDNEHWTTLRSHIEEFRSIWSDEIEIQFRELSTLNDIDLFMSKKEALLNSYKYQAQQFALQEWFYGDLKRNYENMNIGERDSAANTYILYNMFNQDAKLQSRAGLIFGGVRAGAQVGMTAAGFLGAMNIGKGVTPPLYRFAPTTLQTTPVGIGNLPNLRGF